MLDKATGLARALAVVFSLVAAFIAIPNLDTGLVLVALGLVAGIAYGDDARPNLILLALALPLAATAVGHIPSVGAQLGAVAINLGLAAAAAVASSIAIYLFHATKADLGGLTK